MFNHNIPPSDDYVISFDLKKLDLKQHNLIAWVFGHYHYNYIEENSGVLNISTARPAEKNQKVPTVHLKSLRG